MSDALRQSNTDKATSAIKPDSQKSTLESATDTLKSTGDRYVDESYDAVLVIITDLCYLQPCRHRSA
jgi:hypothetical protein